MQFKISSFTYKKRCWFVLKIKEICCDSKVSWDKVGCWIWKILNQMFIVLFFHSKFFFYTNNNIENMWTNIPLYLKWLILRIELVLKEKFSCMPHLSDYFPYKKLTFFFTCHSMTIVLLTYDLDRDMSCLLEQFMMLQLGLYGTFYISIHSY